MVSDPLIHTAWIIAQGEKDCQAQLYENIKSYIEFRSNWNFNGLRSSHENRYSEVV